MSAQSIEYLVDLSNKLNAEVERLEAQIARRDRLIEKLENAIKKLSPWFGESQAYLHILLIWMERAQGDLPADLQALIKEAREKLTLRQNAFLKEFGDLNEPGNN